MPNSTEKKIYELWGLDWNSPKPLTDYTIGLDSTEIMLKKMNENPWPIYKVKLASREDLEKLKALRSNTDAILRIDANAAWSVDDALFLLPEMEQLGIELIEQPLAKDNWEGMKEIKNKTQIPFIADESCVSESDVATCAGHFDGINIKLTKCSGLTPAKRMIEEARKLDLKVMMGCMNETEIGSEAIAHFLPLARLCRYGWSIASPHTTSSNTTLFARRGRVEIVSNFLVIFYFRH
jgi:L-alanine-DL-glutamate epimerase-like enolase superfamily enzyme